MSVFTRSACLVGSQNGIYRAQVLAINYGDFLLEGGVSAQDIELLKSDPNALDDRYEEYYATMDEVEVAFSMKDPVTELQVELHTGEDGDIFLRDILPLDEQISAMIADFDAKTGGWETLADGDTTEILFTLENAFREDDFLLEEALKEIDLVTDGHPAIREKIRSCLRLPEPDTAPEHAWIARLIPGIATTIVPAP